MAPRRKSKRKAVKHVYIKELNCGVKQKSNSGKNFDLPDKLSVNSDILENVCDIDEVSLADSEEVLESLEREEKQLEYALRIKMKQANISSLRSKIAKLAAPNCSDSATSLQFPASRPAATPSSSHGFTETKHPTSASLSKDQDLNAAIEALGSGNIGLDEFLDIVPQEKSHTTPTDTSKAGKYDVFYITDFVTEPTSSCREEEREIAKNLWLK